MGLVTTEQSRRRPVRRERRQIDLPFVRNVVIDGPAQGSSSTGLFSTERTGAA
jgi:hypothetical protein